MPLRDHFHPPLSPRYPWTSFHTRWATAISDALNDRLPDNYTAMPQARFHVEIDVATLEVETNEKEATSLWMPTAPLQTLPVVRTTDVVEVLVFAPGDNPRLVGAIELVSPSNKDRPEARDSFIGKVASLLQKGVCVSIVDLVTVRQANLYADLMRKLERRDPVLEPVPPHLYAVTLRSRPIAHRRPQLDVWFYPMTVGQPLPTIPIWLAIDLRVMLPLESSYEETCDVLGIG